MIQPETGRYYGELSNQPFIETLQQLTQLTWDGDLISKKDRDKAVEFKYVQRFGKGWNLITPSGVEWLQQLGFINP